MKRFITDLGADMIAVGADGERTTIARYAVWEERHVTHYDGVAYENRGAQVLDTGNSVEVLCDVYGAGLPVLNIRGKDE